MTVGTLERRILMLNPMHALHVRSLSRMCDADCPASAAFMAVSARTGLALFFCSHHYNENRDALKAQGFTITDKAGFPA